ncbi:PhzF family phenazine biosynthesis protein [Pseudomonas sp. MG-9]|uniref:PhzF family phenazine biosynthesis protein n=1 Tax=Pseudomonas serboccidentalis TaxID=2964670 RepID=A0ABY7ZDF5_9PSED|nr:PhzF family phenazine biosynthesis protein [Pseudomonas serboccidentalis]MBT9268249.1 PhzF family phenazine biosynthesis protein [Pseudomonas sp. MG-9]WDR37631.1 PhzF family phenazine biosynthesis protein [Pseudomonas serboccidentalis]
MQIAIFQVDAFASRPFDGNPAAVCPLSEWLPDEKLYAIAAENNLSETAFFVKQGDLYELRWFTPQVEVDLCGHATLAAAWVIFNKVGDDAQVLRFSTRSGELRVRRSGTGLTMDFPAKVPVRCEPPPELLPALGLTTADVLATDDFIVVVADEAIVEGLSPDFAKLKGLPKRGVVVTAASRSFDFVSRWFGPNVGVNEDPVTGSAHTSLAPYWAQTLDKQTLSAQQGGTRKGQLRCEIAGDRVLISGESVLYMVGEITV